MYVLILAGECTNKQMLVSKPLPAIVSLLLLSSHRHFLLSHHGFCAYIGACVDAPSLVLRHRCVFMVTLCAHGYV